MRDYGKVHCSFWTSDTIRSLSEDGRTLAFYLLTCPHATIAGVFRLPDGYVCDDLQWVPERVAKGFVELLSNGFANRCETTKWVWIREHFKWNPPENPNQRKAAAKCAGLVPAVCSWKLDFMRVCGPILGFEAGEIVNHSETLPEPLPNQKQEQKQEQKKKKKHAPSGVVIGGVAERVAADFLALRSKQRAPVTETVIAGISREAAKAGVTLEDALRMCCERGWRGFKAEWIADDRKPSRQPTQGYQPIPGEIL